MQKKDDAIQPDVSEHKEVEVSPRDEIVNAIVARSGAEEEEPVETNDEVQEEEKDEEEVEPLDDGHPPVEKAEEMVTIKVNGEERKVPLSAIVDAGKRTLQKETAADQKLDHATRLMRQVEEFAKRTQPPQGAAPPKTEQDAVNLREIVKAIQYGTEEEAEKAVASLLRAKEGPVLTPDHVNQMVEVRLHNQAILSKFTSDPKQGGFGDIASDGVLYRMAVEEVNRRREAGDQRLDWSIYKEAGEAVRQWRDNMVKSFAPASTMEEKEQRKGSVQHVTGAAKKAVSKQDTAEPTISETIAEIASRRAGA